MQQMMGGGAETPKAQSRNVAADGDEDGPHKQWTSVYPIYLDAKRRYRHGCRRVAYHKALLFPNSQLIANAARKMQLEFMHESMFSCRNSHPSRIVSTRKTGKIPVASKCVFSMIKAPQSGQTSPQVRI